MKRKYLMFLLISSARVTLCVGFLRGGRGVGGTGLAGRVFVMVFQTGFPFMMFAR